MSDCVKLEFHRYDYASYAAFFSYSASSLVVPVALMQIADALGFPLADGGMGTGGAIQLGRTVTMTLFLILSGFIAGRFGLRKTIGAAALVMAVGCLGAALANSYWVLFAGVLLAGCGEGYIEAIGTPFVQKLHVQNTGQYMNFAHSFWSVGVTSTTIGAGALLMCGVSWRVVIGIACALAIGASLVFLLPEKKGQEYPESTEPLSVPTVLKQIRDIMACPRFWLFFGLMFVAGGSEFCLTFWLASFMQLSMKTGALLGGLATAVFALGMVTGRMGWGIFVPDSKQGHSLIAAGIIGVLLTCAIPFLSPDLSIGRNAVLAILFVLLYFIGITIAPLWPTLQTYAVSRLPKKLDETMIYILLSSAGVPGCGFFTTVMGILGDALGGLDRAFFLVPACQMALTVIIIIESRCKQPKRLG